MAQDNNNSEKFKKFLQTLPDDKREELFDRLQAMKPEERSVAIDKLVAAYEERKAKTNAPKEPNKQAPVQKKSEPQKPASNKQAPKNPPKKKQAPASKDQPVQKNKPENKKPAQVKKQKSVSKNKLETNKKSSKEVLIVIAILVVFMGLCLGIKILFDDKFDKIVEEAEAKATATAVTDTTDTVATEATSVTTTATEATTPTPSPTPTPIPVAADSPDLTGLVIVIDPGHQAQKSETEENVASWLSTVKSGATSGAVGVTTGIPEYELTLDISLKLKSYLEQCGATVILTRETNDVDITNQERAKIATDNNANIFLRIHADAANDSKSSGVRVFVPDSGNFTGSNSAWGDSLGQKVSEALGLDFIGTKATSLYTGLNYANTVPSFQISLGLLSNSDDEAILVDEGNQIKICEAISVFAGELKESGKV